MNDLQTALKELKGSLEKSQGKIEEIAVYFQTEEGSYIVSTMTQLDDLIMTAIELDASYEVAELH